jgi:hypothetical protein
MKSIFSICRIYIFCFFVLFIFSSCKSYLIVNGNQQVPKKVTIYVTGFDTANGHLIMEDISHHSADPFTAYPGQEIRWKISGITHFVIDNLVEKTVKAPADEVFERKPHPVKFFSESWKGTLKDSTDFHGIAILSDGSGHFINYIYKIVWRKAGKDHTFDPRIQIQVP